MLIDINRIVVGDRIRKDFGDIQELADDIRENGLINPPVINKNYVLLAGERRLRACKSLGWQQIEVRMMDTRDDEHDLEVEISENESRKDFTRSERMEIYTRRVEMELASRDRQICLNKNEIEQNVAKELGTSRGNMRSEREIIDGRELLDPADFAEWDEGKMSTNKAYQKLKAAQKQAIAEKEQAERAQREAEAAKLRAERERDEAHEALEDAYQANELLENENAKLRNQPKPQPETIEVAPADYKDLQKKVGDLSYENRRLNQKYQEAIDSKHESDRKLEAANERLGETERTRKVNSDIELLTAATNNYLRQYGGHAWVMDQLNRIDETTLTEFRKAITSVNAFTQNLLEVLNERYGG